MSNYTHTKKKSRGSQILDSRSVVVEAPQRETQGNLVASFFLDGSPKLARGEKKASSREKNQNDFSLERTALLVHSNRSGIGLQKQAIINALKGADEWKEAEKIENCHTRFMFLVCDDCGAPAVFSNSCNSRICPDCSPEMKKKLIAKYGNSLAHLSKYHIERLKFLTLTGPNVQKLDDKGKVFSELRKAFTKFRHRQPLDKKLKGGLYAIETTVDEVKGWNVHLHALVSMNYHQVACDSMKKCKDRKEEIKFENDHCSVCKNKCLRRLWQECSGSTVLDIKKVYDPKGAVIEIIGYLLKAVPLASPEQLVEWWRAWRNKPYIKLFGEFMKLDFEKPKLLCPWCDGSRFTAHSQGFYT
ncbi:unnamed protein product, partial [marine sediment metagenome]